MIIKRLNEINAFIDKTVKDHDDVLARLRKEESEAKAKAEEAKETLIIAKEEENIALYNESKRIYSEESDIAGMYTEKISEKEKELLINTGAYMGYVSEIRKCYDDFIHECALKVCELYAQADAIGKEMYQSMIESNNVLERLQEELYKNSDREMLQNGGYSSTSKKTVSNDLSLIRFAERGKGENAYSFLTGEKRNDTVCHFGK